MNRTHTAGGVVLNRRGEVLVVSQHGRSWSLPKGHMEMGEQAIDAAKREIQEETGINRLVFVRPLGRYDRMRIGLDKPEDASELKTIYMFLFLTDQEKFDLQAPEHPEARWVRPEDVASLLTHPLDRRFFTDIIHELPDESKIPARLV